jgi:nucleotide-binding universal stress UspA family protein
MAALQHILVANDFGSSSTRAVHLAAELATRFAARLTVLHVVPEPLPMYAVEAPLPGELASREARELAAKHDLDAFLSQLAEHAPLCEGVIRFGDPAREIVAHADETACSLIVVGTHGRKRLARLLLGSVAEAVVRSSPVPVLTVRAEEEAA